MSRPPDPKNSRGGATLQVRSLPAEDQNAWALLEALEDLKEPTLRKRLLGAAGASEPIGAAGLRAIANLYTRIGFPLNVTGIARFKKDRGLAGGTSLGGQVARAYVRALDGNEIIVRVDIQEERELRPSELACLEFLRELARRRTAADLRPAKKALGLGNPPMSAAAEALDNEWVGMHTVKALAQATMQHDVPLSPDGLKRLASILSATESDAPSRRRG